MRCSVGDRRRRSRMQDGRKGAGTPCRPPFTLQRRHITLPRRFPARQGSTSQGHVFTLFIGHMKNVLLPPHRHCRTVPQRAASDPHKTVQRSGGHRHRCLPCTRIICHSALSTLRGGGSLRRVKGAGRAIPQPLHQSPAAAAATGAIPHGEEANLSCKGGAAALRSAKMCAEACFFMQTGRIL